MQLNNDFSEIVVLNTADIQWQPSLITGLSIQLLEQEGARSTAILHCASGTQLAKQLYELGEEIIVLEGKFADESGVYPAGSYLKNPPGFSHALISKTGCTLFIKQGHLQQEDIERVVVNVENCAWRPGMVDGLSVLPLSEFKGEHSALVNWRPDTVFNPHRHWGGEEIYVLEGVFEDEFGRYPAAQSAYEPACAVQQRRLYNFCQSGASAG